MREQGASQRKQPTPLRRERAIRLATVACGETSIPASITAMQAPALRPGVGLCLVLTLASCLPIAVSARLGVEARAKDPAVCSGPEECDAVWAKAADWVAQHCAFKIQTRTDSVVQTEGPLGAPNTDVACLLQRVPFSDVGAARLELSPSCGNWFECDPERDYLQAKFNDDMRAATRAGQEPTKSGPSAEVRGVE
jgi:hypothetical protein